MKRFLFFAVAVMLFAGCSKDAINEEQGIQNIVDEAPATLTVGFEDDETRIQLNEAQKTVWTNGDLVSVFYRSDANQKWQYTGETGARTADLTRVDAGEATKETQRVVVVYPYNENYYFNTETYNVQASLPATQTYLKDSYGLDGNIMISQSEYNNISLKNVCGWLKLQLTGNGEQIKSITVRGNNGEQVAGELYINSADATATLASDMGDVTEDEGENATGGAGGNLVFEDTVLKEVTLNCLDGTSPTEKGVALGAGATSFYIALPPQTFTKGITVDITAIDGSAMTQSTDNEVVIERNHIKPMAAFTFENNGNEGLYIPDEALKAYLVNNYDDDFDGEISVAEADNITMVNCLGKGVADLTGLESCPNLVTLNCSNNNITTINLPNLKQLKTVTCNDNPIEKLNFDNCSSLQYLNLQGVTTNAISGTAITIDGYTQANTLYFTANNTAFTSFTFKNASTLTSLEFYGEYADVTVTDNTALTSLVFYAPVVNATLSGNSVLEGVDVSSLLQLETLDVQKCKLQSLDVTKNVALTSLVCNNNQLTTLDVSNNTALVKFYCNDNKLPKINVTANTALQKFDISNNQISALNIRSNTALTYLNVSNNADLSMVNVQNNTLLQELYCNGIAIGELSIIKNIALTKLECHTNPYLTTLTCNEDFDFTTTHISINKGLIILSASGNVLTPEIGDLITVNLGIGVVFSASNGSFKIVSAMESNQNWYNAGTWCLSYGADWYFPTRSELESMTYNLNEINSTLDTNGYQIINGFYWSSSSSMNYPGIPSGSGGGSPESINAVRAVLEF